jgi:transcriptional regulator with XRE-family HTH domain
MAKANLDAAKEAYPSVDLDVEGWMTFLRTSEGFSAMGRIIGDIYDELLAIEDKERGHRSLGRRPSRVEVPLDEVFAKVFGVPQSNEPFPVALASLLVGRSQRQFASRVPMDQSTLSRLLSGIKAPTRDIMERIATAARVDPAYFSEWRAEFVADLVRGCLVNSPHVGVKIVKNVRSARRRYES